MSIKQQNAPKCCNKTGASTRASSGADAHADAGVGLRGQGSLSDTLSFAATSARNHLVEQLAILQQSGLGAEDAAAMRNDFEDYLRMSTQSNAADNASATTDSGIESWLPLLGALELDDARSIGYTYKCMAAGLWAISTIDNIISNNDGHGCGVRDRDASCFKACIKAIVLEAGDSDTNCAVAGALMGCRIGYSGLPQDWVRELAYAEWLEAWVQKLLFMMGIPVAAL